MFLRKIVLAFMAFLVFAIPISGGQWSPEFRIGPLGLLSIVGMLAFLFAIASLLFGQRGLGRNAVPMDLSVTLFAIFVALNLASVGWAQNSSVAISSSISYLQLLVFVWLLLFLRSEPKAFSIILHSFFLGSILLVTLSLYDVLSIGLDALERQRLRGFDIQVNRLALKLALGIPIAFYLSQRGLFGLRWISLLYVPAAVFLVLLTGSRTGMAATLFALLAGVWLLLKVEDRGRASYSTKRLLIFAAVGTVVVVSIVPFVSERFAFHAERVASLADPLDTEVSGSASGFGGRQHLWESALAAYADNPVLGVGSGGSRAARLDYTGHEGLIVAVSRSGVSVHSAYLAILSETGTVGMLLYLAVIVTLIVRIRAFPRQEKLMFLSLMGVALIVAIAGTVETVRDFNLALFLSVIALQPHQRRSSTSAATDQSRLSARPGARLA